MDRRPSRPWDTSSIQSDTSQPSSGVRSSSISSPPTPSISAPPSIHRVQTATATSHPPNCTYARSELIHGSSRPPTISPIAHDSIPSQSEGIIVSPGLALDTTTGSSDIDRQSLPTSRIPSGHGSDTLATPSTTQGGSHEQSKMTSSRRPDGLTSSSHASDVAAKGSATGALVPHVGGTLINPANYPLQPYVPQPGPAADMLIRGQLQHQNSYQHQHQQQQQHQDPDPMSKHASLIEAPLALVNGMNASAQGFSRFIQLIQLNLQSVHMSISSVLQLAQRVSLIRFEFLSLFKTFTALRLLYLLALRLRRLIASSLSTLGIPGASDDAAKLKLQYVWTESMGSDSAYRRSVRAALVRRDALVSTAHLASGHSTKVTWLSRWRWVLILGAGLGSCAVMLSYLRRLQNLQREQEIARQLQQTKLMVSHNNSGGCRLDDHVAESVWRDAMGPSSTRTPTASDMSSSPAQVPTTSSSGQAVVTSGVGVHSDGTNGSTTTPGSTGQPTSPMGPHHGESGNLGPQQMVQGQVVQHPMQAQTTQMGPMSTQLGIPGAHYGYSTSSLPPTLGTATGAMVIPGIGMNNMNMGTYGSTLGVGVGGLTPNLGLGGGIGASMGAGMGIPSSLGYTPNSSLGMGGFGTMTNGLSGIGMTGYSNGYGTSYSTGYNSGYGGGYDTYQQYY